MTVPDMRLNKDFGTLLERGSFSDVTVVADDVEFKAHKAVLAGMMCCGAPGLFVHVHISALFCTCYLYIYSLQGIFPQSKYIF